MAKYTVDTINEVIEYAMGEAAKSVSAMEDKIAGSLLAMGTSPQMAGHTTAPKPVVTAPNVDIPAQALGADLSVFNEQNQNLIDQLVALFTDYFVKYFPVDNATLAAAEAWLQKALTEGGTGVNAGVEQQIWERDRDRILADAARAMDEVAAVWAAKRFPIPPGALQNQTLQIQQKAQAEIAQSSREIAIKVFQTEVENVRFALENAIKLRQVAMASAADYIKALASSQTTALQLSVSQSEAQAKLIGAAAAFYGADTAAKEMMFKATLTDTMNMQEASKENLHSELQINIKKADVAVAAAQSYAHQAAAALGTLHTQAGMSVGSSEQHNYNYEM